MEPIVMERSYTGPLPDASLDTVAYRLKGRYDRLTVLPVGEGRRPLLCLGESRGAALFAADRSDWRAALLLLWFAEQLALALEGDALLGGVDPVHLLERRGLLFLLQYPPPEEQETLWRQFSPARLYLLRDAQQGVGCRLPSAAPEASLIARLLASCGWENGGRPLGEELPQDGLEARFTRLRGRPALSLGLAEEAATLSLPGLWSRWEEQLLLAALL